MQPGGGGWGALCAGNTPGALLVLGSWDSFVLFGNIVFLCVSECVRVCVSELNVYPEPCKQRVPWDENPASCSLSNGILAHARVGVVSCGPFEIFRVHWPLKALRSPVKKLLISTERSVSCEGRTLPVTPGPSSWNRGEVPARVCGYLLTAPPTPHPSARHHAWSWKGTTRAAQSPWALASCCWGLAEWRGAWASSPITGPLLFRDGGGEGAGKLARPWFSKWGWHHLGMCCEFV